MLLLTLACETPPTPEPRGSQPAPAKTTAATTSAVAIATSTTAARIVDSSTTGEAGGVDYILRYTGGATAADELPMIVAIHGLGDRPSRFGLLHGFPGTARVVLPRGILDHHNGFSWFDIRVRGERDSKKIADGMGEAITKLSAMLAIITKRYPTRGTPVVTGFSQGGMLSFALAVQRPGQVALALPVAGWLPAELWPDKAPPGSPPIVALHGDNDAILKIDPTRDVVANLRRRGFDVQLMEYPGVAHNVSGAMRRELYRRLAEAIAPR